MRKKTLVKNKNKKKTRRTKKRRLTKYIGGDISVILNRLKSYKPDLFKKINDCIGTTNYCDKNNVFKEIRGLGSFQPNNSVVFSIDNVRELITYFDGMLRDSGKYYGIGLKEDQPRQQQQRDRLIELQTNNLQRQQQLYQQQQSAIAYERKASGSQEEGNRLTLESQPIENESPTEKLKRAEENAIRRAEGTAGAWERINTLLTNDFSCTISKQNFKTTVTKNGIATIDESVYWFETYKNGSDYLVKLREFINLLYRFSRFKCYSSDVLNARLYGFSKCLYYEKELLELRENKMSGLMEYMSSLEKYSYSIDLSYLIRDIQSETNKVKNFYANDQRPTSIIIENESKGLLNLLVNYCKIVIIDKIDYSFESDRSRAFTAFSENTGWRTSIVNCIKKLVLVLFNYEKTIGGEMSNVIFRVKKFLMDKICKIVFIKKQTYSGLAVERCDDSTKQTEDYKDFNTLVDNEFGNLREIILAEAKKEKGR